MQPIGGWEEASRDLGLSIEAPYTLTLENGDVVTVPFLLKQFGGESGTLVTSDYSQLEPHVQELSHRQFGTATWDVTSPYYDRHGFIKMLSEWGWADVHNHPPQWLLRSA